MTAALESFVATCDIAIPLEDIPEWRDVPEKERVRVWQLLKVFAELRRASNLHRAAHMIALRLSHQGWGWSAKTLLNLFWAYRDGGHKVGDYKKRGPIFGPGDWRVLVRDYAGKKASLPPEFTRWLAEQWTEFKGRDDCVRALHRHVVGEIWLKGLPVPGYGTIEEWCLHNGRARPHPMLWRQQELPEGWSPATFYRLLPKRRATRASVQHGYLAAHGAQPDQVLGDRSRLLPLQYVILDDVRCDVRCMYWDPRGQGEIVYPLMVAGLDAASTIITAHCGKPRAKKRPEAEDAAEKAARHGVSQDMALIVVLETIRRWGVPPWGITFVHENAAACIPAEAKAMLASLFGNRIRFETTAIVTERLTASGFVDTGGAPWSKGKAALESFWHLLNVQLARLPGSTGARYDATPGALRSTEAYTLQLMERARGEAEFAALFKSSLLSFEAVYAAFGRTIKLLEMRTDHALQGFDRVEEWRRSPADSYRPIHEFLALPQDEQDAIAAVKGNLISRRECPAERFCRLIAGAQVMVPDDDTLTFIQGPRRPVTVRDGKITVSSAEHGDDALVFRESGHPLLDEECEGRRYVAAISGDGQRLALGDDQGRILGGVNRQARVDLADRDALHREIGRVMHARTADRDYLRGYLLTDTEEAVAELRRHNAAALASVAAIPQASDRAPQSAVQRAKQSRRAAVDAEIARAEQAEPALAETSSGGLYGSLSDRLS